MAKVGASRDIVDLTGESDHSVGQELENLRLAASRAQNAASRYLKHKMSLGSARNPQNYKSSSSLELKPDYFDSSKKTMTLDHAVVISNLETHSQDSEDPRRSHDDEWLGHSSHTAGSDPLQPRPVAVDSGLGESVSGTEDSRPESHSPIMSQPPQLQLNDILGADVGDSAIASHSQADPTLPPATTGESQVLTPCQLQPKAQAPSKRDRSRHRERWSPVDLTGDDTMTLEKPRISQLSGFTVSQAADDKRPGHQMRHDLSAPKKRGRHSKSSPEITLSRKRKRESLHSPTSRVERSLSENMSIVSSENMMSGYGESSPSDSMNRRPQSSLPHLGIFKNTSAVKRNNLAWSASSPPSVAPRKTAIAEDSFQRDSSCADREDRPSLKRVLAKTLSLTRHSDPALTNIVKEIVYPTLKIAVEDRKGLLSEDKLILIAKTVSPLVVSEIIVSNDDPNPYK